MQKWLGLFFVFHWRTEFLVKVWREGCHIDGFSLTLLFARNNCRLARYVVVYFAIFDQTFHIVHRFQQVVPFYQSLRIQQGISFQNVLFQSYYPRMFLCSIRRRRLGIGAGGTDARVAIRPKVHAHSALAVVVVVRGGLVRGLVFVCFVFTLPFRTTVWTRVCCCG